MKSKVPYFAILLILPLFALAKDIKLEAKNEFDACIKETKNDREQCNFGGCGNIAGACHERQINIISLATDFLAKKLNTGRCAQAKNSALNEIENLNSKLKSLTPFDGTWSGYDIQVEVALLKISAMKALEKECEPKN